MKLKNHLLALIFVAIVLPSAPNVAAESSLPTAPDVAAESWVLIDYQSGQILAEKNARQQREPASLTKMLTSYIISDEIKQGRLRPEDLVTISENAWKLNKDASQSSLMFVEVGKQVSVADLHRGIVIQSGNDASVAMAEHIAGSEAGFAQMMNATAKKIGMQQSQFKNATGLGVEGHFSNAYDMAWLGRALIRDFPEDYGLYSEKEFTFNGIKQPNRNDLLWDSSMQVDGIKTGHTSAAGYCLVSSAVTGNMRLIAAVLGADSMKARAAESKKILGWGFRSFDSVQAVKAGVTLTKPRIWFGASDLLAVGLAQDANVVLARGKRKDLKANFSILPNLEAPIAKGQIVGKLFLQLDGKDVAEYPLVALQEMSEGGLLRRLTDWFSKKFQ